MDISKIKNASIRTPGEDNEPTTVTVNDQIFTASSQSGAISQALDYLGEETTPENIVEFIEVATKGIPSPKEKRRSKTKVVVADAHILRNEEPGTNLTLLTTLVEVDEKPQTLTFDGVDKILLKTTFVGKLYTDKEGYVVYEVTKETPPTDWQFTLQDLRDHEAVTITLNLKEFKELIELVPKRSGKKG